MVNVKKGNIFTSNCNTIVNTVNCVGVMGAGLALECRLRYPEMHKKYKDLCHKDLIQIGKLWLYKADNKWILNFPTKKDWKHPSKIEFIEAGLIKFVKTYKEKEIESIAFPILGADKGGLDPELIIQLMRGYLDPLPVKVEIYQYDPCATDDLYEDFYDFITLNDINYLSNASGLRRDYVLRIIDAIKCNNIFQLNQLGSVKGIGIKTLEKLFQVVQKSKHTRQTSLF